MRLPLQASSASLVLLLAFVSRESNASPPATDDDDAVVAPESSPEPAEPATAIEWYSRGIELASAEAFAAAAIAFLRSYALQPTPEALFNAAFAFENASSWVAAVETYQRVLEDPALDAGLARQARESIGLLLAQLAVVEALGYDSDRPPARLWIGGEERALDELPILLSPGHLEVEVVDEQGLRGQAWFEFEAGQSQVLDLRAILPPLELETLPDPPPFDPGPTAEEIAAEEAQARRAKSLRIASWTGLGLTAGSAIAWATLGGLALSERAAFEKATCFETGVCPPGQEPDPEGESHRIAGERYTLAANIMIGVTAGLAVATLTVGLIALKAKRRARTRARAHVRLSSTRHGIALEF